MRCFGSESEYCSAVFGIHRSIVAQTSLSDLSAYPSLSAFLSHLLRTSVILGKIRHADVAPSVA